MVTRNKAAFGLLVLAIVCGVVAGLGVMRAAAQVIAPNAICAIRACNALNWPNPATDSAGNPLPAGATCTMSVNIKSLCIATPGPNCTVTGNIPLGCDGSYTIMVNGMPVFIICYQPIAKC